MSRKEREILIRQWIKIKLFKIIVICILILGLFLVGAVLENYLLIAANTILAFVIYCFARNKIIILIENNTDRHDDKK